MKIFNSAKLGAIYGSLVIALASQTAPAAAAKVFRPTPEHGTGSRTLVAYAHQHFGYSLANSLNLVKLQLARIDTRIDALPLSELDSNAVQRCDYLVIVGPEAGESGPTNLIAALAATAVPVLWIGENLEPLQAVDELRGSIAADATLATATTIQYRGRRWDVRPFSFTQTSGIKKPLIAAVSDEQEKPFCFQVGRFTLFGAEPQGGLLGFVFEDILFDFYRVKTAPSSSILLRVRGYSPASDHREMRRVADYLFSRSIPFVLSVRNFAGQFTNDNEFVSTLRYAQHRGGRLIIEGAGRTSALWNFATDKAIGQSATRDFGRGINQELSTAFAAGLLPIAWQTPESAASPEAYRAVGQIFSTSFERVQLSEATARGSYGPGGLTLDAYGRLIVPENAGYITDSSDAVAQVEPALDLLAKLRGTILCGTFDSFVPLERLVEFVSLLEQYRLPFLDVAELPNRVQLGDQLLLTGTAAVSLDLKDTTIRWKTFNRLGALLAEDEQKTRFTGHREFKRIGIGVFELVQFKNGLSK